MTQGTARRGTGTTPRRTPSFGAVGWTALAGLLLVARALGDGPVDSSTAAHARPPVPRTAPQAGADHPAARPLPPSDPVSIRIPDIGVAAELTRLGLDHRGRLRPPPASAAARAGWYADGTAPGARGAAVVTGHVDSPSGPAVFYRLGSLTRGAEIDVDREDGRTAVFTVDAVEVHAKNAFPDDRVYGPSGRPVLRLITCGGSWRSGSGYDANVVVYATLTAAE
ncbi:class F sortase [Streptomyces sp. NPDC048018]|uniref:class F sortase n=1 Tax=Streptomyces sp. NPDC048018 TaxID=3365499 RepID=UPI0037188962